MGTERLLRIEVWLASLRRFAALNRGTAKWKVTDKKMRIALHGKPFSELRDVTYHTGSHSVTCHPTQVNTPRLYHSQ